MKITSPSFKDGQKIPAKFTPDGTNVNPGLIISQIAPEAKSIALIVEDPDAKKVVGYTWIHWALFNIPIKENKAIIKENSIPGTAGQSTYKKKSYGGPSPPKGTGTHHYHFKTYSLDKELDLPEGAQIEEIKQSIRDHFLEEAEIIGTYSRD